MITYRDLRKEDKEKISFSVKIVSERCLLRGSTRSHVITLVDSLNIKFIQADLLLLSAGRIDLKSKSLTMKALHIYQVETISGIILKFKFSKKF